MGKRILSCKKMTKELEYIVDPAHSFKYHANMTFIFVNVNILKMDAKQFSSRPMHN